MKTPWYDALDLPGARQLAHVKALLFSRPFLTRVPDQSVIHSGLRQGLEYVSVTRDGTPMRNDATYLMAYFPQQGTITFKAERLAARRLRGWWFNPRDGSVQSLGEMANEPRKQFSAPTQSKAEDWVLVLDDAAKGYPPPGQPWKQERDR